MVLSKITSLAAPHLRNPVCRMVKGVSYASAHGHVELTAAHRVGVS